MLQVLHIVTLGGGNSYNPKPAKGGFFPNGVNGNINSTAGYTNAVNGKAGYPGNQVGCYCPASCGQSINCLTISSGMIVVQVWELLSNYHLD